MKIRESNFELLRIFAMVSIIFCHYNAHSGVEITALPLSFNKILLEAVGLGGSIGNITFVLLAGYFGCGKNISIKKVICLWGQTFFYSMVLFFVSIGIGVTSFSAVGLIKSFAPIVFNQYWFITVYIIIYLLSPYINVLISNITNKSFFVLLSFLTVIIPIIGTLKSISFWYSNLLLFIYLFLLGAFMKKNHNAKIFVNKKIWLGIGIGCYIFMVLTIIIVEILSLYVDARFYVHVNYFTKMYKIPMVLCATAFFLYFKNIHIKPSQIINVVASATFGIYLFHDNIYFRDFLWVKLLKNGTYFSSPYLFLHVITSVCLVFVAGFLIEMIRKNTFEVGMIYLLSKLNIKEKYDKINLCFEKFVVKIR